jgi:hypothetical protein
MLRAWVPLTGLLRLGAASRGGSALWAGVPTASSNPGAGPASIGVVRYLWWGGKGDDGDDGDDSSGKKGPPGSKGRKRRDDKGDRDKDKRSDKAPADVKDEEGEAPGVTTVEGNARIVDLEADDKTVAANPDDKVREQRTALEAGWGVPPPHTRANPGG